MLSMKTNISQPITAKQSESPLCIGIIVDSVFTNKHVYEFAEWANKQNHICVSHVIVNQPYNHDTKGADLSSKLFHVISKSGFYDSISDVFFNIVQHLEKLLLKTKQRYENQYNKFNLISVVANHLSIRSITSDNDYYIFDDAEINRIKELNLDIIIKYCGGIFCGDIINAARLGTITIQYANDCFNRGNFPGFWEVYSQQDTTEFSIKHLTDKVEDSEVLIRGKLRTQVFFLLNQSALYEKASYCLRQLIKKIASQDKLPPYLPSIPCSNSFYYIPKLHNSIYYSSKLFCRLFVKMIYKLFGYRRQWSVSFVRGDWRNAMLCRGVSIKNPPNHFLADPFVISRFGKDYCFVEDWDFSTEKGCIVVYELYEKTSKRIGVAIEEPFHMSFPYLFEFQDDLYMCPETADNKDIRIYKCLDFPCRWELESVAMKELSAVDSMLFEKDGKWWMLTSIDHTNTGDYAQALSIFYADSPLSRDWKAHPNNPIYIDSTKVRNAGLLKEGNRIFRVSQAQGFDVYGKQTLIFEIIEISEFNFTETQVAEITPSFKKGIIGTHHFHSNGKVTVFDCLDYSFIKKLTIPI